MTKIKNRISHMYDDNMSSEDRIIYGILILMMVLFFSSVLVASMILTNVMFILILITIYLYVILHLSWKNNGRKWL